MKLRSFVSHATLATSPVAGESVHSVQHGGGGQADGASRTASRGRSVARSVPRPRPAHHDAPVRQNTISFKVQVTLDYKPRVTWVHEKIGLCGREAATGRQSRDLIALTAANRGGLSDFLFDGPIVQRRTSATSDRKDVPRD